MQVCMSCRFELDDAANYCSDCGSRLPRTQEVWQAMLGAAKARRGSYCTTLGCAVIVVGAVLTAILSLAIIFGSLMAEYNEYDIPLGAVLAMGVISLLVAVAAGVGGGLGVKNLRAGTIVIGISLMWWAILLYPDFWNLAALVPILPLSAGLILLWVGHGREASPSAS